LDEIGSFEEALMKKRSTYDNKEALLKARMKP
jgi:hypothetical protein